jgi:hypothetical protein
MIVSAWSDGGGGYGFRVLEADISLYFRPEWDSIMLHLPDENNPVRIPLTSSFWTSAPELRSLRIRSFFERYGVVPWVKKRPPHFELVPLGEGAFRLNWLDKIEGQRTLPLG